MTFISYSQNFEDVYINRIFNEKDSGFYVDIGAHHPEHDSVTKSFYDRGWRGINIEPIIESFQKFEEQRPRDINLNVAIGDKEENSDITYFYDTGLSTLSDDIANIHISESNLDYEKRKIKVRTLNNVFMQHNVSKNIDFLKIDVEGFELNVLLGLNLQIYRPTLILLEDTIPTKKAKMESSQDIHNYLINNNYTYSFFDGLNSYFIKNEKIELSKHFDLPVNIFDDFSKTSFETCNNNEDFNLQLRKFKAAYESELINNKILLNSNKELKSSISFLNLQKRRADILLNAANINNTNHFNQWQHVTNQMGSEINIRDNLILEQEHLISLLNTKVNSRLFKTLYWFRKISRIPKKIREIIHNLIPSRTNIKRISIFLGIESYARTLYKFFKHLSKNKIVDNFGEEDFVYNYNLSMPKGKIKYLYMFNSNLVHDDLIIANPKDKNLYMTYINKNRI